jgi:hypothetical protein
MKGFHLLRSRDPLLSLTVKITQPVATSGLRAINFISIESGRSIEVVQFEKIKWIYHLRTWRLHLALPACNHLTFNLKLTLST